MNGKRTCCICSAASSMICSKCKLAWYCSKEHQTEDWPKHKKMCFPLRLTFIADRNREHYVAKSDIKEGQIIHLIRPIMIFPMVTRKTKLMFDDSNDHLSNQSRAKVCLSCCEELSSGRDCPKCKWPVCNEKCAKDDYHSKLECSVLAENNILFENDSIIYTKIQVLRALLFKRTYPEKWKELIEMKSTNEFDIWMNERKKLIYEFIITKCKLKEFDFKTIMKVIETLENNAVNDFRAQCRYYQEH